MATFKEYESKPITRLAHCITEEDVIKNIEPNLYTIGDIEFQAYEDIKPGGYVVYLTEDDVYYCNEEVFKERNIV